MPSFSFLNPSFLWLLPLVAIPVLIHLISRKKIQVLDYPSLKFLREAYMKRMRYLKINELLLLLVRAAIVCLLVFAFSRFAAFVADDSPGGAARVALVIDDSFSSQYAANGVRLSETIRREAQAVIAGSAKGSRFLVLPASRKAAAPEFLSAEKAAEAVGALGASDAVRSFSETIGPLSRMENYSDLSSVVILSDFLTSDRNDVVRLSELVKTSGAVKKGPGYRLFSALPGGLSDLSKNANFSVLDASVTEERVTAGRPFTIKGRVRNHSIFASTVEVSLFQDDDLVARVPVGAGAGADAEFSFTHSFMNAGEYAMRLSLPPDQVAQDNDFRLIVRPVSSLYVLIMFREDLRRTGAADYRYLATALNPASSISLKDGLIIQPVSLNLNAQAPGDFSSYDAVIAAGIESLDTSSLENLHRFVSEGGGLLLLPPAGGDLAAFSKTFAKLSPVIFDSRVAAVASPGESSCFNFTDIAYDHPIFSLFKNRESGDMTLPRFFRIIPAEDRNIAAPAATTVLARFERNVPALLERRVGRGVSLTLMGFLDPVNSDFTSSPLFVPFVHQVFYHINRNRFESSRPLVVGSPISTSFSPQERVSSVACRAPGDQREFRLDIRPAGTGFAASFPETTKSGIYTFFKKTDDRIIISKYAVNPDPRESSCDVSEFAAVSDIFSRAGLLAQNGTAAGRAGEKRVDLSQYLFLIALALLAAESYLVMKTRE